MSRHYPQPSWSSPGQAIRLLWTNDWNNTHARPGNALQVLYRYTTSGFPYGPRELNTLNHEEQNRNSRSYTDVLFVRHDKLSSPRHAQQATPHGLTGYKKYDKDVSKETMSLFYLHADNPIHSPYLSKELHFLPHTM